MRRLASAVVISGRALLHCRARPFFMTDIVGNVIVDFSGLKRFGQQVDDQLNHRTTGPITKAFKQWGARYRSFIQERYDKYSKGGGDWPRLSWRTLVARRKGKGKKKFEATKQMRRLEVRRNGRETRKVKTLERLGGMQIKASILRDTNTMFSVVSPVFGKPGQLQQGIAFGIRVGYGGNSRHPGAEATIADIARFHQEGAGHLPKREIIVEPTASVISLMAADMQRAVDQLSRGNN